MEAYNAANIPSHDQKLYDNTGQIDPSIRILLAMACFGQMFIFEEVLAWQPYIAGFGIYLIMTVLLRRDPIYTLFSESSWLPANN